MLFKNKQPQKRTMLDVQESLVTEAREIAEDQQFIIDKQNNIIDEAEAKRSAAETEKNLADSFISKVGEMFKL